MQRASWGGGIWRLAGGEGVLGGAAGDLEASLGGGGIGRCSRLAGEGGSGG